jgi:hypothetical protein
MMRVLPASVHKFTFAGSRNVDRNIPLRVRRGFESRTRFVPAEQMRTLLRFESKSDAAYGHSHDLAEARGGTAICRDDRE